MLRKTFGPKKEELTFGVTKLHNGEFCCLSSLPDIVKRMK